MKVNLSSYTIKITWIKAIAWIAALWFFVALLLTLTNAIDTDYESFARHTTDILKNNSGDKGAIIIITTWLIAVVTVFVRHKPMKIIVGLIYMILGIIIIIGIMITKSSANNAITWVIPSIIVIFVGLWWVLEGFKIIKFTNKTTKDSQVKLVK